MAWEYRLHHQHAQKIGAETEIAETPETLKRADKILLPGVGTFDNGMKKLKESHLIEAIQEETLNKRNLFRHLPGYAASGYKK